MILDQLGLLSDAQSLSATALSTNTVDLGNVTPKRQIGTGETIGVVITVDVAADFTTGDETYDFQLVQSAAEALTSPTVLARLTFIASGTMISSLLVQGYRMFLPLPHGMPIQRYLGMNYVLGGTTPTITVTACLVPERVVAVGPIHYAKGYTISG